MPDYEPDDLASQLARFSKDSKRSHTDIAQTLTSLRARPGGRSVSKTMVYNYVSGITPIPGWFVEGLDIAYPGWRNYSLRTEFESATQGQAESAFRDGRPRFPEDKTLGPVPVLMTVASQHWDQGIFIELRYKDVLDRARTLGENESRIGIMHFPKHLIPHSSIFAQPVGPYVERYYKPWVRVGDVLWLDPTVYPVRNTLHAVTFDHENDEFLELEARMLSRQSSVSDDWAEMLRYGAYAACVDRDGRTGWELQDSTFLPFDACTSKGAVIAHFPQYRLGRVAVTLNEQGLDTDFQITWPLWHE